MADPDALERSLRASLDAWLSGPGAALSAGVPPIRSHAEALRVSTVLSVLRIERLVREMRPTTPDLHRGAEIVEPVPAWQFGLTATEISIAESLCAWFEADAASRSACLRGAVAAWRSRATPCSDSSSEDLSQGGDS